VWLVLLAAPLSAFNAFFRYSINKIIVLGQRNLQLLDRLRALATLPTLACAGAYRLEPPMCFLKERYAETLQSVWHL
jgi:hypothetical protein